MKKHFVLFVVMYTCLLAQMNEKKTINVNGRIMNVSEKENCISIIYVDKKNKTIADLYNLEGKKLLSVSDPINNGLLFAEYTEKMDCYIICYEGYEGNDEDQGKRGYVKSIKVSTGEKIWECPSDGLYYEISPNEEYILTKATQEIDELSGELEVIKLSDGKKNTLSNNYSHFKAAWLDNERILIISNTESKELPQSRLIELKKWRDDLQKREQRNIDNYRNKKITQTVYELNEKRFSKEFFEQSRKFTLKIEEESIYYITSNAIIYNVIKNKVEIEKNITDKNGKRILVDISSNYLVGLTKDKENNLYILCKEPNKDPVGAIYSFLKFDKNLNLIWQSPLLPLAKYYSYKLEGKPYFGLILNGTEMYVEPTNGKLLPSTELKSVLEQVPTISLLEELRQDTYIDHTNVKIDFKNNSVILR